VPEPAGEQHTVRVVLSAAEPLRGMERAALDVADLLRAGGLAVEVRVLAPGPPPRTRRQRARSLVTSFATARAAVRDPAGAVVLVGTWVALRALPWARRRDRVVAWEHSCTRERVATSRGFRLVTRLVLPMARRRARAVVAVSPAVAEALSALGAPGAVVIANPVAAEPAPPPARAPHGGPLRLLALGGLVPVKQPHLLLDALAALPRGSAHLDVAGDGPLLAPLRTDAARRGLAGCVTFHGHVPDVAPLLAHADVLVHTSASETFGYALLEAAAAGVPVVAVENTQTRHLVPHLVPGRTCAPDGAAIADAVRAPGDGDRELAWRARQRAFDPAATLAAWREVLQSRVPG
jgi:glycosyltransferase involved in cell wall biosynthesis